MNMNLIDELYQQQIRPLSTLERLQLVHLIMDDLADSAPSWVTNESDTWSAEDIEDITRAALTHASRSQGDENSDA
jgi:hypothetical protein